MWPFKSRDEEVLRLKLENRTLQIVASHQADTITQMRAAIDNNPKLIEAMKANPAMRPCECGSRWFRWHDGRIAGPDGVVGTADDDLVPGSDHS